MSKLASHPYLLLTALLLVAAGFLMRRLAGRWDLKSMAIDVAKRAALERRVAMEGDAARHLDDLRNAGDNRTRAKLVAGHAARHAVAQVLSLAGIAAYLAAAALLLVAALW